MNVRAERKSQVKRTIREHDELRQMLREFHRFLAEPEAGKTGQERWPGTLSERLFDLYDWLLLHFREEEDTGLPEEIAERLPHVADRADSLRGEHSSLLGEHRDLLAATFRHMGNEQSPSTRELRERTMGLLNRLARHEEKETELIQRAYLEDLGGLD